VRRPEVLALAGLAVALGLTAGGIIWANRPREPVPVSAPAEVRQISVHVTGEVAWPGLYVLKAGSRVQDAVFAAHGPTLVADLKRVNLAAVLRDGDRVVIPRITQPPYPFAQAAAEEQARLRSRPGRRPEAGSSVPAGRPPAAVSTPARRSPEAGEPSLAVNVNTATAADLERLPGVGPVLARRIVEFREARGLFRRLEDLQEVQGIGARLYRRLEPHLRLDDGTSTGRGP
jgi:competence protein ComEA